LSKWIVKCLEQARRLKEKLDLSEAVRGLRKQNLKLSEALLEKLEALK